MSHFLARLVERARGTAARVEPAIAPRFAPTPIVEIASQVEASPPERRDRQPNVEKVSSPRPVIEQEAPAQKTEAKAIAGLEKPSPPQQSPKLLVPAEMSAVDSRTVVRQFQTREQLVPVARNSVVGKELHVPSPSRRPGSATPATTTSRKSERQPATPNESPEQPPIVRVTIGRIDVRATRPAAQSRKSSTRSEPKLTLDAYLKSRREGTR
jgi:hypothetical protein